jgi:ketosteroid isomerase-like protein
MEWGEEYMAAWNAHDEDALVAQFAPDCRYLDLALGLAFEGHDGIRAMFRATQESSPDFRWESRGGFRDGDRYVIEFTYTASPGGRGTHSTKAVSVGRLDGEGRIVENHDYWNPGDFPGTHDAVAATMEDFKI